MLSFKKLFSSFSFACLATLAIFFILLINPAFSVRAEIVRSYESSLKIEDLKIELEKLLKKIDDGNFEKEEKTSGFSHHYESDWFSYFKYNIYIGPIFTNKKYTILHMEGNNGDVQTLARIFQKEGLLHKDTQVLGGGQVYTPEEKYHIFAQTLNLLSPSISTIYQSYSSPRLEKVETISRVINYLLLDLFVYWMAGNRFFTMRHSPGQNQEYIIIGLAINRFAGALQSWNVVAGHNNIVRIGYTFPIR